MLEGLKNFTFVTNTTKQVLIGLIAVASIILVLKFLKGCVKFLVTLVIVVWAIVFILKAGVSESVVNDKFLHKDYTKVEYEMPVDLYNYHKIPTIWGI